MLSPAPGNRVIGFLRAVPAMITIHAEIAPGEAADAGIIRQVCNKILQVDACVTRQHITAIGKAVNDNRAAGFCQTNVYLYKNPESCLLNWVLTQIHLEGLPSEFF